jgi:YTH domain-containing family protein
LQAIQKSQAQGVPSPPLSPANPPQTLSPANQNQQTLPFNMVNMNANALAYQMSQMTPMMQMQLQMNMGMGSQFGIPQAQAMHQSVLRHPSPGPSGTMPVNGQGFMGMHGF